MAISVSHGRHNDSGWIVHQFGKGLRYRYRLHRRIPGRGRGGGLVGPVASAKWRKQHETSDFLMSSTWTKNRH
jgi:hypothetical protein